MPVLLVDDRDGRILEEMKTPEDVQRVLAAWTRDTEELPDYLCLVEVSSHQGSVFATDSSVKIRPLS